MSNRKAHRRYPSYRRSEKSIAHYMRRRGWPQEAKKREKRSERRQAKQSSEVQTA
jgi:hypothetical protein